MVLGAHDNVYHQEEEGGVVLATQKYRARKFVLQRQFTGQINTSIGSDNRPA
jgi:hypothetical protein